MRKNKTKSISAQLKAPGLVLALGILMASAVQGATVVKSSQSAVPFPTEETPKAKELGDLRVTAGKKPISITIALRLPNLQEAEDLLKSLHTPGDPQFRKFLTGDEFVARFAPKAHEVQKVIAGLSKYGLKVKQDSPTTLKVTGLPAEMERAFKVSLRQYEVPATDKAAGYIYHAPLSAPSLPKEISQSVVAALGLDSRPKFKPRHKASPKSAIKTPRRTPSVPSPDYTYSPIGEWTVTDFAHYYDVEPLYRKNIKGQGQTLAIVGLASFTPSDAFAYWASLGLKVNPNRLTIVNVDGGPGAPSDASGSVETALDVEQSGGIAPGANIILYQAPNINQSYFNAFVQAIDDNLASSISTSWGTWEFFDYSENTPVIDPTTGQLTGFTQALHEQLVRAAIQGQSVHAASGDGGGFDVNNDLKCYGPFSPTDPTSCSLTLSVDYPGSDPAITSTGATTIAANFFACLTPNCTPFYPVIIPHERVWGWDYFINLCSDAYGVDPITCGIFAVGSGGGVSILFDKPSYQNLPGIQTSEANQLFEGLFGMYAPLPADFTGRNVPDISFNADPFTGYIVYYTSSVTGFGTPTYGGTSFTSQQLNGISVLFSQYSGGRIGLLNYHLYDLAKHGDAYGCPDAPLNHIPYGDNWFYRGTREYNPAVGLGTMNVASFAKTLLRHEK